MNIQKTILACAITTLGLVGCGTEQQDTSNIATARSADNQTPETGIVVDGPVVRATVFYDLNGNLKKDINEPSAITDGEGYFNTNPITHADYCRKNIFGDYVDKSQYCLEVSDAQSKGLTAATRIIITGGYDLYTGEPFEGSMSAPAQQTFGFGETRTIRTITPLSSITSQSYLDGILGGLFLPATDVKTYLLTLGIANYNVNYLESEQVFNAKKFATTYQMHKFVSVVADWVKDLYPEIGENDKLPEDVSSLVYMQFQNFHEGNFPLALTNIAQSMKLIYDDAGVDLPDATTEAALAAIVDLAIKLTDLNLATIAAFGYTAEDGLGSDLTFANVKARMRGVEVVVLKIIRGLPHGSALAALDNQAYLNNLAGNLADNGNLNFTQLVEFPGDANALAAESALAAADNGVSLSDMIGKSLRFEDDDPSVNSKAAIFFTGTEGRNDGQIHLCLKYEGNSDVDLNGNYISGIWDILPALNNTLLLELNIFGGTNAVLKKVGVDGTGATQYRFDYAEKITKFSSTKDFELTADLNLESIPNSNEACQAYLGVNAELL